MARWNQAAWNSGALWGPTAPPLPAFFPKPKTKNKTMKRQRYFPRTIEGRPEWFGNYAIKLTALGAGLGLAAPAVAGSVADALYLEYCSGSWLRAVREFGPACTSALDTLYDEAGGSPFVLPPFATPPLPAANPPLPAVVPVTPGALQRIFLYVQTIKAAPAYSEAIGLQLGIVGPEDAAEHLVPTFSLKVEQGAGCQCVKIMFKKYGHSGVAIYSKRGTTEWELLGIDMESPYLDERPLLVATAPEMRQYRLRYFDGSAPNGDYTEVATVTVSP